MDAELPTKNGLYQAQGGGVWLLHSRECWVRLGSYGSHWSGARGPEDYAPMTPLLLVSDVTGVVEGIRVELKETADSGIDLGYDYLQGMASALRQIDERVTALTTKEN